MTQFGVSRVAFAVAVLLLLTVFAVGEWRDLNRGLHGDEVEHLHATLLVKRGLRPFADFFEHHPPLFWAMLRPLAPDATGTAAMRRFASRARLFSGAAIALAILSMVALLWRATGGSRSVVVTYAGIVLSLGNLWRNGLGDIRPDSTALGIWWFGTALVLLARRPWARGAGIGLVFAASVVKPQWPLASIVVAVFFVLTVRRDVRGLLVGAASAAVPAALAIGATAMMATLRDTYYSVFVITRSMLAMLVETFAGTNPPPPFIGCPPLVRPAPIALAAVAVILALSRTRIFAAAPAVATALLWIAAAALGEIFFLLPFPVVGVRFYSLWALSAAAILALLPFSAAALLPFPRVRTTLPAAAAALALVMSLDFARSVYPEMDFYWRYASWLERQLRPGDTVWSNGTPIDAPDASYYWFELEHEAAAVTLRFAQTPAGRQYLPRITEADLPPCRVERGLDRNVRAMVRPRQKTLPIAAACFERLRQRGIVYQLQPYRRIWLVQR